MAQHGTDAFVFLITADSRTGGSSATGRDNGIFTQREDYEDLRAMVIDAVEGRFLDDEAKPLRCRLQFAGNRGSEVIDG